MDTSRNQQKDSHRGRKRSSPGKVSLWVQRRMNARTNERIRRKGGRVMGMDLLILHTVGRRSGQRRETPVTWFADSGDARLVVASGGGGGHPDWYRNLMAHPERAAIEVPGHGTVPVIPRRLDGAERTQAWQRITTAQPRYAKYQRRSDREYPVIRLTPR